MNQELTLPQTGLVAYYNFNQGVAGGTNTGLATLTDNSGNGLFGTLNGFGLSGSTSNWIAGTTFNATQSTTSHLNFDGVNDYVSVPNAYNIPTNGTYTLEAMIKPSVHATNGIVGYGDYWSNHAVNAFRLGTNNTIVNYWWSNDLTVTAPNSLADGSWHHVAATFDGTTRTIYLDGVALGHDNPTGHAVVNTSNFTIGETYTGEFFNGSMDEVRVWNVARSQSQIQTAMNNTLLSTDTAGLVAYYSFEQGSAGGNNTSITLLADKSIYCNNGILDSLALYGITSNWVTDIAGTTVASLCAGSTFQLSDTGTGGTWSSSNTSIATVSNTGLVTGVSSGTATISYTVINAGGCSATAAAIIVTVNAVPTATITPSGVTTFCTGGSVTLTATAGSSYLWNTGATMQAINITTSGSYSVNATIASGCSTTSAPTTVTVNAMPTVAATTQFGNSLNFNGSNTYINISRTIQDDYTIEFWMNTTQTGPSGSQWYNGYGIVDAEVAGVKNDFGLSLVVSKLAFGVGNPDNTIFSISNVNTGSWVHVAAKRSKSSGLMQLFINGVLEASFTSSNKNSLTAPTYIALGRTQTGIQYYSGNIDELRLWNAVRTNQQILTNYTTELVGTQSNLVNYYKFDQGVAGGSNISVTTLTDNVGSNNATLNNFALTGATSNWVAGTTPPYSGSFYKTQTLQLTNPTTGGSWASTNTGVATADNTGLVTGVTPGSSTINYTITNASGCSITTPFNVTVKSLLLNGNVYLIQNMNSNLAAEDSSTTVGTQLYQNTVSGNTKQLWRATNVSNNTWVFTNLYSGKVWETQGNSNSIRTPIVIDNYNSTSLYQQWNLKDTLNGHYTVQSKGNTYFAEISGGVSTPYGLFRLFSINSIDHIWNFNIYTGSNYAPQGNVDGVSQIGSTANYQLAGWAFDNDIPSQSINVQIYVDGTNIATIAANGSRPDVNTAYSITGNHGFTWQIPSAYYDGFAHTYKVYAVDATSGSTTSIGSTSYTYTLCTMAAFNSSTGNKVAVSPSGAIWKIGTDGYVYKWNGSAWIKYNSSVTSISFAVDNNGIPRMVGSDNVVYCYSTHFGSFQTTGYSGKKIASNAGKTVIIGTDNNIYQLSYPISTTGFSTNDNNTVINGNVTPEFAIFAFTRTLLFSDGTYSPTDIAVSSTGTVWFIDPNRNADYLDASNVRQIVGCNCSYFTRINCDYDGSVLTTGTDYKFYKYSNNQSTWVQLSAYGTANTDFALYGKNALVALNNNSMSISSCFTPATSSTTNYADITLEEKSGTSAVSIFPNPANSMVTVKLAIGMEDAKIDIVSTLGVSVVKNNETGLQLIINLGNNAKGMYVVKIIQKDGSVSTHKLLLE